MVTKREGGGPSEDFTPSKRGGGNSFGRPEGGHKSFRVVLMRVLEVLTILEGGAHKVSTL